MEEMYVDSDAGMSNCLEYGKQLYGSKRLKSGLRRRHLLARIRQ